MFNYRKGQVKLKRSLREIEGDDVDLIIKYFIQADDVFLNNMGVDPEKLPKHSDWHKLILDDLSHPLPKRQFYYLIWLVDNEPIGHSNINKIRYGDHAYLHLHLWRDEYRQIGNGAYFISACIDAYFEKFNLKNLFCEPYALNPAPNKTLARTGFELIKQYETTPGWINFHQMVNRWCLSREKWLQIKENN